VWCPVTAIGSLYDVKASVWCIVIAAEILGLFSLKS
jgi:hypothetical protein